MIRLASFVVTGLLFASGLVISGMTQPSKIIGFLDFFGNWDPSLALVMAGAVSVHAVSYKLILRRESPIMAHAFEIPHRRDLDLPLLAGSALFGVGWGLGGYCPGPALTSLPALEPRTLIFVGAMVGGMGVYGLLRKLSAALGGAPDSGKAETAAEGAS